MARGIGLLKDMIGQILPALGFGVPANRFVLTIGDEGATLVQVAGGRVVDALFVAADAEAGVEEGMEGLREVFDANPQTQVIVAADMLEQMFREDKLPKVGFFDRAKILERRLEMAFPNEQLRAALPLGPGGPGELRVMLMALPRNDTLDRWIAFLDSLSNPLLGFCLLPLELVDLPARLAPPAEGGDGRPVWRALITKQATSGYRQVFEVNGQLVITRLTQTPPREMEAEAIALLIQRELRSSLSYIKRLGYNEADRLDVVVLVDPEVCRAVEKHELPVSSVTLLTPHEAAMRLGLGSVGPEDSPFADTLYGLSQALKARPRVILPTTRIAERLSMTRTIRAAALAALVLTLVTLVYVGAMVYDFFDAQTTASAMEQELETIQASLLAEEAKVKDAVTPLDELLIVSQTEDRLSERQISPAGLFRKLDGILGPTTRLSRFAVVTPSLMGTAGTTASQRPNQTAATSGILPYEIQLVVRFTAGGAADGTILAAKDILGKLIRAFPGHKVEMTSLPVNALSTQVLEGSANAGGTAKAAAVAVATVPTAKYLIRRER